MSVPTKGKLSYLWACATGKDQLYSRVFEEPLLQAIEGKHSKLATEFASHLKRSRWLRAEPCKSSPDAFRLYLCIHDKVETKSLLDDGKWHYKEIPGKKLCNRETALKLIQKYEKEWMDKGSIASTNQPFKKKTTTVARLQNLPAPPNK